MLHMTIHILIKKVPSLWKVYCADSYGHFRLNSTKVRGSLKIFKYLSDKSYFDQFNTGAVNVLKSFQPDGKVMSMHLLKGCCKILSLELIHMYIYMERKYTRTLGSI